MRARAATLRPMLWLSVTDPSPMEARFGFLPTLGMGTSVAEWPADQRYGATASG